MLMHSCNNLEYILKYVLLFDKHLLPSYLKKFFYMEPKVAVIVHGLTIRIEFPNILVWKLIIVSV